MEYINLFFQEHLLATFQLSPFGIDVGCDPSCDIVVNDPQVNAQHWLIKPLQGSVFIYSANTLTPQAERSHLPLNQRHSLGQFHQIERVYRNDASLSPSISPIAEVELVVGQSKDARTRTLNHEPCFIGKAKGNTLVLHDDSVSDFHCRLDYYKGSVRVRDLGSRSGTYIQGLKIINAHVPVGSVIRVGQTNLTLLEKSKNVQKNIVGASLATRRMLVQLERAAKLTWPTLILGETGVGKELIAQHLFEHSSAHSQSFVTLNCGGLTRELVESELFGHEKGAFTGATQTRKGAIERAHHGTLFLDEIGELPLDLQTRLLRVIEGHGFYRVGGDALIKCKTRFVLATHRDLAALVREGSFREDLYYRLSRLLIRVAPLRQRKEDIQPLTLHFLHALKEELGTKQLSKSALKSLHAHAWPGNVRELRNVLSLAALYCPSNELGAQDIESALEELQIKKAHDNLDLEQCSAALSAHQGNIASAARALGVPRSTLRDRLKQLGLNKTSESVSFQKKFYARCESESAPNPGPLPECA